ncbi:hypothetical protein EHM69_01520 [candidate division KSB1 bacterium]|nr:MAG: hypothetical protein EHM69_01520 [candidate division KSB1 bacterium]
MGQRINVTWGIVIALLCGCVIWIGYSNYRVSKQIDKLKQQKIVLGTDAQLEETVNTLEKNLDDRLAYKTHVETDPFDMTKVIQSKEFLNSLGLRETLEQQGRMRLSCTITGESPAAILKFMGRSNIVHEGDTFNGFHVDKITSAQVFLSKGGSKLVLVNESAPEGELTENQGKTSVSGQNY